MHASPSFLAHALEVTDLVSARRAVQARIGRAVVYVDLARSASIALATVADECVVKVYAAVGANRIARIAKTLIDLRLALQPNEAWSAPADKSLQLVDACGTVLAWIRRAIVDGVLTLLARVTGFAGARIVIDLIDALAVIMARFGRALVNVSLTGRARPSRMADAFVAEKLVHADPVEAGITRAKINLLVTTFAGESGRAVTGEVINQVGAVSAEQARSLRAIVGVDLAALTLPSR